MLESMTDSPMPSTARMQRSIEENRIAARDRAVAVSVARKAIADNLNPYALAEMGVVQAQLFRAAEQAAYEAILKERELHLHEMAMLKAWMEARAAEDMLKPRVISVAQPVDIPRAQDYPSDQ